MSKTLLLDRMLLMLMLATVSSGAWPDEQATNYDRISLSASASTEVDNDTMIAVLYHQREGTQANQLADDVNRRLRWAVERSKKVAGVKVKTLDYQTTPVYRDGKLHGWRVRQSIRLESRDSAVLSNLIGELQEQLAVQSMTYSVSPVEREKAETAVIAKAIRAFTDRAAQITGHLNRRDYRLVHIDVSTNDLPIHPRVPSARALAMAAPPPPAIEPGTQTVRVTVSGTIELEP